MKSIKIRLLALLLVLTLSIVSFTGCGEIDFGLRDALAGDAASESAALENESLPYPGSTVLTGLYDCETDTELFVYGLIVNELGLYYDVYSALVRLSSGVEVYGIGFTDYSEAFKTEDGEKTYFCSGFISFVGEAPIPASEYEAGLEIVRYDEPDEDYGFAYTFSTEAFTHHCVVFGNYVTYGVSVDSTVFFTEQAYDRESIRKSFDESLGTLYSYDEERVLNDLSFGEYIPIGGISTAYEIDYAALEAEIERIIAEQDYNLTRVEIETAVYIAQDAINSYLLSLQQQTFLGYNVDELVEISKQLDPMECIRITSGGVTKDYIKIKYAKGDVLYVPVTQLDLVSKYIGGAEEGTLKLHRLGGAEWHKTRKRVKGAVKEMAKHLTALYA